MTENISSLVVFTKAAAMLAEANTIQKAKELKDMALTAADWAARKGAGEQAIQHCRGYAMEAERRMGEMLAETERAKRGPDKGTSQRSQQSTSELTLSELGLTKNESSKAQALAAMPVKVFEAVKSGETTRAAATRKEAPPAEESLDAIDPATPAKEPTELEIAQAGIDELIAAIQAARAVARRVFKWKDNNTSGAPYLGHCAWNAIQGDLNAYLRMLEDNKPVGGTAAKPRIVREDKMAASLAKGRA